MFKRLLTTGAIAVGSLVLIGTSANADVLNQRGDLNGTVAVIPDVNAAGFVTTVPRNITVVENEIIQDVSVTIEGLNHTFAGDLVATLTRLDSNGLVVGPSIDLFNRIQVANGPAGNPGDSSDFNGSYTFASFDPTNLANPSSIWSAADDFTQDEFIPNTIPGAQPTFSTFNQTIGNSYFASDEVETPLDFASVFGGQSTQGIWQVQISDQNIENVGSFTGVTINFDSVPVVPEPGSIGLLAAGALGFLVRRRRRN